MRHLCGADEIMKRIWKIKIGMYLTAILMPVFNINAQAAEMETLPAAIVTAEGRKLPTISTSAVYRSSPLAYSRPDAPQTSEKHFTLLIRTNTLYDAALTPNIGLEVGLGKGWSITGNVMYGWWTDRNKFYWRTFATDIGVRKYFGSADNNSLSGHHLGLYAGIMTWDFELGGRGSICDYREEWGRYFGIDYGYSLPIAENLNLDFSLGLGYAGGRYMEYLPVFNAFPEEWHYVWQSTNRLHYFGPTRLEVSLVWVLDLGRKMR